MRLLAKSNPSLLWDRSLPERQSLSTKIIRYGVCIALLAICKIYFGWCGELPPPGKAVLAIGVVAAIMAFDLKSAIKITCMVLIFALAFLENASINRDRRDAETTEAHLLGLANNTASSSTQAVVLSAQINDKADQIIGAQKKNDPSLVSRLEAEKRTLQRQQLLAVSRELFNEMMYWNDNWAGQDQTLQSRFRTRVYDISLPEEERKQAKTVYDQKLATTNLTFTQQLAPLFASVADARSKLLLLVPSKDNKKIDAIFAQAVAGQAISWGDMQEATSDFGGLLGAVTRLTQPIQATH